MERRYLFLRHEQRLYATIHGIVVDSAEVEPTDDPDKLDDRMEDLARERYAQGLSNYMEDVYLDTPWIEYVDEPFDHEDIVEETQ